MNLMQILLVILGSGEDPLMNRDVEKVLHGSDEAKLNLLISVWSNGKPVDAKTIPSSLLFDLLRSESKDLRRLTLTFLAHRKWNEDRFLKEFTRIARNQKEDTKIRCQAVYFIIMNCQECLGLLREFLKDNSTEVRIAVVSNLHRNGLDKNVGQLRAVYAEAFENPSSDVRDNALWSLREAARKHRAILDLHEGAPRLTTAYFLGARAYLDPKDKTTISSFFGLLFDKNRAVREAAASGLQDAVWEADFQGIRKPIIEQEQLLLINEALLDKSAAVRGSMCFLAGYLPAQASPSLGNLGRCLGDEEIGVREWAVKAAGWLKEKRYIPDIVEALKAKDESSESARVRYNALEALVRIGENSPTVVNAIQESVRLGCIDRDEADKAIRKLQKAARKTESKNN